MWVKGGGLKLVLAECKEEKEGGLVVGAGWVGFWCMLTYSP